MQFLVKDLMITVFPSKGFPVAGCDAGATCACSGVTPKCGGCSENPCTSCSSESKGMGELFTPVINPASPQALAALKNQLREIIAAVEGKELALQESMRPKTPEEINVLQGLLSAALDDLKLSSQKLTANQPAASE